MSLASSGAHFLTTHPTFFHFQTRRLVVPNKILCQETSSQAINQTLCNWSHRDFFQPFFHMQKGPRRFWCVKLVKFPFKAFAQCTVIKPLQQWVQQLQCNGQKSYKTVEYNRNSKQFQWFHLKISLCFIGLQITHLTCLHNRHDNLSKTSIRQTN